jgi:hypothetical protein
MTAERHEITFWVAINETGDFVVNTDDASSALSDLESSFTNESTRVYEMHLTVTLPKIIEVTAELPDTDGPVSVTVNT